MLFSFAVTAMAQAGESASFSFSRLLGQFHPLLVHLPIGFLVMLYLLEIATKLKRFETLKPAVTFTLVMASAAAVISAVSGYLLAQGGDYGRTTLLLHQWTAIALALSTLAALVLKILAKSRPGLSGRFYYYVLGANLGLLLLAGHFGGTLTHGKGYLAKALPPSMQQFLGGGTSLEQTPETATDSFYFSHVQPIFDRKCIGCHNADKLKGKLDLSAAEPFFAGGKSGPAFVPGDAGQSLMVKKIESPIKSDGHMPPESKPQLTVEEVNALKWWIEQGGTLEVTGAGFSAPAPAEEKAEPSLLEKKIAPADSEALQKLREIGINAQPISLESNYLQVSSLADNPLATLRPVAEHVVWLDLAGTEFSDSSLAILGDFPNLLRLYLEKSSVTDQGLAFLSGLKNLEYLNLFETAVTDSGIEQLRDLPRLKSLYLGRTQVSEKGMERLRERFPGAEIVGDLDVAAVEENSTE